MNIIKELKTFAETWIAPKEEEEDFVPGSLKITPPDGKTSVSMDIVTRADERRAQALLSL